MWGLLNTNQLHCRYESAKILTDYQRLQRRVEITNYKRGQKADQDIIII